MPGDLLYYGDNLDMLRHNITNEFVDLIYLDPPFNPKADYNLPLAKLQEIITSEHDHLTKCVDGKYQVLGGSGTKKDNRCESKMWKKN